jgi:hypothetical protein
MRLDLRTLPIDPSALLAGDAGANAVVGTGNYTYHRIGRADLPDGQVSNRTPVYQSIDELKDLPAQLYANGDIAGYKGLMELVKNSGFTSWSQALQSAAMDTEKSNRSWEEYLRWHASLPGVQEFVKTQGSGGPTSYTNTSVNKSSLTEAGRIADENFKSELGRGASADEVAAFQKALNEQQAANPTVQQQYNSGGKNQSIRSTTSGGFDYTRFAREYAQSQEGYAERYAGQTFMKILDTAIGNPNALDRMVSGNG